MTFDLVIVYLYTEVHDDKAFSTISTSLLQSEGVKAFIPKNWNNSVCIRQAQVDNEFVTLKPPIQACLVWVVTILVILKADS